MTEREQIISDCDAGVDTYHAQQYDVKDLLKLRRDLAVNLYRLSAHIKDVHGQAGLTYMRRKFRIAESIVDAKNVDAKAPMNLLEVQAQKLPSVIRAQEEEIWAEAEKEALKSKLDFGKQVLASMQQDLAFLTHEHKTTAYYNTQEKDV